MSLKGLIPLSARLPAIALNAMKAGVSGASFPVSPGMIGTCLGMPASPKVSPGLACYGPGALSWLRVLAMAPGFVLLGETPHLTRLAGAGCILAGAWLVGMR